MAYHLSCLEGHVAPRSAYGTGATLLLQCGSNGRSPDSQHSSGTWSGVPGQRAGKAWSKSSHHKPSPHGPGITRYAAPSSSQWLISLGGRRVASTWISHNLDKCSVPSRTIPNTRPRSLSSCSGRAWRTREDSRRRVWQGPPPWAVFLHAPQVLLAVFVVRRLGYN